MTITCTYHCSACGSHFHSLEAFDSHRSGDYASNDPNLGRHCDDPADRLDASGNARLVVLTDDGECRMYADVQTGVAIWTTTRQRGTRPWDARRQSLTAFQSASQASAGEVVAPMLARRGRGGDEARAGGQPLRWARRDCRVGRAG